MKYMYLTIGIVSTLYVTVFAEASAKDDKPGTTPRWEQWERYEKDEDALRIRNDRIKSSGELADMLLQADARKLGPGTLLIEYTVGMCTVKKAVYSVQHGDKKVNFTVDHIDWTNQEMVVSLPGTLGQDTVSNKQSFAIKCGEKLDKYLQQLTEKYGKGNASENSSTNVLNRGKVMTWTVGDGYLEIETTLGAGIIKDITYVISNEKEKQKITLKVKEVDLIKGEMTIVLPNGSIPKKPDRDQSSTSKK